MVSMGCLRLEAMKTVTPDSLVADYLRRLEAAASALPQERRAELLEEIREHVDDALRETCAADEVAIRNVLERLGPPEEIAAAAGAPGPDEPSGGRRRRGRLEIAALIALAVPVVGWLVGAVLVVVSEAWSAREKAVALLLASLPLLLGVVVMISAAEPGSTQTPVGVEEIPPDEGLGPLETAVLAFGLFGGLASALYLGWRLRGPTRTARPGSIAPTA
jgi:uncharacterized membrane protein